MASISRSHDAADRRSGGKIIRSRRTAARRTPYGRPSHLPPNSSPQNPNWLSKLILSPTRMIATGAGKVLSVLRSESSSSSSSYEDSTSEGDSDEANDDTGVSSRDANQLEKFDSLGKDPQAIPWKGETKRAIEHLLMQETFSREECDKLNRIIESRVVDPPLTGVIDGTRSDIRNRISSRDIDMPDLRSAAVTKAKNWLEVKKFGSNTKPQLECGTCNLKSTVSPHVTEGEFGSPVDLAKSYMRERPPWSSPSMKDIQLKSPSFMGTQLFKDDTPYLYSSHSVSASKLIRDSPSTGSWNITEEIRKVRSKATEDMLRTRPLFITDISMSALEDKRSPRSIVADKAESVSLTAQDRLLNQASPLNPATSNSLQSQDLVAVRITEEVEASRDRSEGGLSHRERLQPSEDKKVESQSGKNTVAADGPKDTYGADQPVGEDPRDSRSHEINDSTLVEVTIVDGGVAANGFPSPRSSLHEGEENIKLVNSGHDNNTTSAPIGETCEPLSDTVMEVPIVSENGVEVTVTQNGSSKEHEVVLEEEMLPLKRKAGVTNEKEQGGRQRYPRKGKGQLK